jgi:hypothetical protein
MQHDPTRLSDKVSTSMSRSRGASDGLGEQMRLLGRVEAVRRGPDGRIKARCVVKNLITATGDQYYAGRAALSSSLPAQATGMRLGTGSTAVAKTGAGAAIVTYLSGSNKAFDSGFPTVSGGVVTYKRTYAAGEATTASAITEAVINNDTITNDNATTATAANTISRVLLTGIGSKGASDTLTITWTHTLLGA